MKKKFTFLFMASLTALALFTGCKKDDEDDDTDNTPVVTSTFSAKIDGTQFTASSFGGLLDSEDGEIWLTADNSTGSIDMHVADDVTPGTYSVYIGAGSVYSLSWQPESGFTYFANPGSIVITKHDVAAKRIEGTFSATLESTMPPTMQLTDGVFRITYSGI